eukprot:298438-Rhodomonas_salina.2
MRQLTDSDSQVTESILGCVRRHLGHSHSFKQQEQRNVSKHLASVVDAEAVRGRIAPLQRCAPLD